ncbi:MAG: hypothetical protein PWQ06_568 [Anaerophaga sp.]|nr:hypothetical protein [Anaerophaga sp.]
MRRLIFLTIIAASIIASSCDPIEDRQELSGRVTADELNVSAVPVLRDGMNSNYIALNSEGNSCLSTWDYGFGTVVATKDTVQVMLEGENEIKFIGLNGDGSIVTKTITVQVDVLYDVAPEWELFCGEDGEKTWVWDGDAREDGRVWGNGGYRGSTGPDWWGRDIYGGDNDISEETPYGEHYDNGSYMVFSIKGAKLMKSNSDGSYQEEGTFSFDFSDEQKIMYNGGADVWAEGKLYTKNVTVLNGISQNDDKKPVYEYDVLKLTGDRMVLAYKTRSGWSEGMWDEWGAEAWFWLFKAAEE